MIRNSLFILAFLVLSGCSSFTNSKWMNDMILNDTDNTNSGSSMLLKSNDTGKWKQAL